VEINIECLVKQRINEMDLEHYVKEAVSALVTKDVRASISKIVDEECRKMVSVEITKVLEGPVDIDNGWGSKSHFDRFDDLFRQALKKAMSDNWEAKKEIEKQVSARVQSIMSGQYKDVVEKIVNGLTGSYLKKPDK